jgi:hypothetical protein
MNLDGDRAAPIRHAACTPRITKRANFILLSALAATRQFSSMVEPCILIY